MLPYLLKSQRYESYCDRPPKPKNKMAVTKKFRNQIFMFFYNEKWKKYQNTAKIIEAHIYLEQLLEEYIF